MYSVYVAHLEKFTLYKYLSRYIDVSFLLKFLILFAGIYSFNFGYMSLIDDRGLLYSPFMDQHLNYFALLRSAIIHMANLLVHGYGIQSYIPDIFTLKAPNGHGVYVGHPCLGYGMMSFWMAFMIAQDNSWQKKVFWCIGGVACLWFLNCCRVALLVIAVQNRWNINKYADNHTLFNWAVYALTILMVYGFYLVSRRKMPKRF